MKTGSITIYQPNSLVGACFDGFGLLHLRLFIAVLKHLQPQVLADINGTGIAQEIGYKDIIVDCIGVAIPLKEITTPNHYPQAITAARDLLSLSIRAKQRTAPGGHMALNNIFTKVGSPQKVDGAAMLHVHLPRHIVGSLTILDKNNEGKAINFTKFSYEIAMAIRSKHALRFYLLLSSWKNKGGFHITVGDLKNMLGLGNGYDKFSVFRKEILLPAQKELEQLGDCWFNASDPSFLKKQGRKVTGLSFRVVTKKTNELCLQKILQIENILRLHGGFRDGDMKALASLFAQTTDLDALLVKVIHLVGKRTDENKQAIVHRVAYISKSLLSALPL